MSPQEFEALFAGLRTLRDTGFAGGAAMATLLRTRGPVFRRAGARMLVFGDGRVIRGLSAGCPEADIAGRARDAIKRQHACLLRYDRESGYDTLIELGCGGEMEVLVEPLLMEPDLKHADITAHCLDERRPAWLMTAFAVSGSCTAKPRRVIWDGQTLLDELADGEALDSLLREVEASSAAAGPRIVEAPTRDGTLQVLLERLEPVVNLVLVGVNTTTLALSRLAHGLGWRVQLVDHREDAEARELPPGASVLRAPPTLFEAKAVLDRRTAVVVMTHNLQRDLEYLSRLRERSLSYLGAVGSRQRVATLREALGITSTPLHAPAGLDLAAETPEEIALSIAAEIQGVLNGRAGGSLSHKNGPLH